jgi:hypothetical protein
LVDLTAESKVASKADEKALSRAALSVVEKVVLMADLRVVPMAV